MSKSHAEVRARADDDLEACERLARVVHELDGYPVFMPDGNFRRFVADPAALGAWVAEADGEIIGHVALHSTTSMPVVGLLRSRLGVARSLLEVATEEARSRGLVPILDVVPRHEAAIALYESDGWERLGTVTFDLPDGTIVDEFVYRAPDRVPHAP